MKPADNLLSNPKRTGRPGVQKPIAKKGSPKTNRRPACSDCLVHVNVGIGQLNSDLGGRWLPLIDIDRACTKGARYLVGEYEVLLKENMLRLTQIDMDPLRLTQIDMDPLRLTQDDMDLLSGGGKVNQKGGFGSKAMVYDFVKSLCRFIKRAGACSILAGAVEFTIKIIFILLTKVGVSVAAMAPAAANVAVAAATASSALTVIPTALIAGAGFAIALEIFHLLRSDSSLNQEGWDNVNRRIDEARRIAAQGDLEAAALEVQARYLQEGKNIQLQGTVMVGFTHFQMGQVGEALSTGQEAFTTAVENLPVLNLVVKWLIEFDKLINSVADLPEDMITVAKELTLEPDQSARTDKFYELKGKVIISTLLLGAGLPSPLLQGLSVAVLSAKIGSVLYNNVEALYKTGLGEQSLVFVKGVTTATLAVFEEILRQAAVAGKIEGEATEGFYKKIRGNLETAGDSVEGFNHLIQLAKGASSEAQQQQQQAQAQQQQPQAQQQQQQAQAQQQQPQAQGPAAAQGGGSRRRTRRTRRTRKTRNKRKTIRRKVVKKSVRKKSLRKTKKNKRKTKRMRR